MVWTALQVQAQIPSPLPNTYVNDFAKVLTTDEIEHLNQQINALEKNYSIQIAVVLVNKLPDSMDIADFARGIGRQWHAGINDSGLVYVASISQRKQRLEVSTSLEGIIPDLTARAITDRLKPYFRKKDYAGGLALMLSEIAGSLNPIPAPVNGPVPVQPAEPVGSHDTNWPLVGAILCFLAFFVIMFVIIVKGVRRKRQASYSPGAPFVDNNNIYLFDPTLRQSSINPDNNNNNIIDKKSSGSSDYGNWGGSSDSSPSADPGFSSSDSGFSGGGSSNDW